MNVDSSVNIVTGYRLDDPCSIPVLATISIPAQRLPLPPICWIGGGGSFHGDEAARALLRMLKTVFLVPMYFQRNLLN
jgi:hypothetical protein